MTLKMGPTPGQKRTLEGLGYDPDSFRGYSQAQVSAFIRRKTTGIGRQKALRGAQKTQEGRLHERERIIEERGLCVGMQVRVLTRAGRGETQGVIAAILPNSYVELEGQEHSFIPDALMPSMT